VGFSFSDHQKKILKKRFNQLFVAFRVTVLFFLSFWPICAKKHFFVTNGVFKNQFARLPFARNLRLILFRQNVSGKSNKNQRLN